MEPYNPYQAPAEEGPWKPGPADGAQAFRVDGKKLAFSRTTRFPSACVKCGTQEPSPIVRRMKQYSFVPWYGRLFGVIGAAITQRKATVELPLCGRCDMRERSARRALWITLGITFGGVAIILLASSIDSGAVIGLGVAMFLGGLLASLVVFLAVSLPRRLPLAVRIDDAEVTLVGVHPRAVEYFTSGAAR
jgi:hypothetical protein